MYIIVHLSKSVRDLGVFLDSELQMKVHVSADCNRSRLRSATSGAAIVVRTKDKNQHRSTCILCSGTVHMEQSSTVTASH